MSLVEFLVTHQILNNTRVARKIEILIKNSPRVGPTINPPWYWIQSKALKKEKNICSKDRKKNACKVSWKTPIAAPTNRIVHVIIPLREFGGASRATQSMNAIALTAIGIFRPVLFLITSFEQHNIPHATIIIETRNLISSAWVTLLLICFTDFSLSSAILFPLSPMFPLRVLASLKGLLMIITLIWLVQLIRFMLFILFFFISFCFFSVRIPKVFRNYPWE